jgi:hypothetical protein
MNGMYRQGDVLIQRVDQAPESVVAVPLENGRIVLAHGEVTGHAHAITNEAAQLVSAEGAAELYLIVNGTEPVALEHEEHATIMLPPATYRVSRQVEYTPDAIRVVAD